MNLSTHILFMQTIWKHPAFSKPNITCLFMTHTLPAKKKLLGPAVLLCDAGWERLLVLGQRDDSLQVLSLLGTVVCSYSPSVHPLDLYCQPTPDGFAPFEKGREEAHPYVGGKEMAGKEVWGSGFDESQIAHVVLHDAFKLTQTQLSHFCLCLCW